MSNKDPPMDARMNPFSSGPSERRAAAAPNHRFDGAGLHDRLLRHHRRRECVHGARRDLHLRRRGNREFLSRRANVRTRRRHGQGAGCSALAGRRQANPRGRWNDTDRHYRARRSRRAGQRRGRQRAVRAADRSASRSHHRGWSNRTRPLSSATPTLPPANGIWSSSCRARTSGCSVRRIASF